MPDLPEALGWIAAGAALSGVYLYLIGRTVAAVQPPAAYLAAGGYLVLRIGVAAAAFTIAAMQGVAPPLLMLAAFVAVRVVVVRHVTER